MKNDLSEYLHIGTVRDFRIKSSVLQQALNENIDDSSNECDDESQFDEEAEHESVDSNSDNESIAGTEITPPTTASNSTSSSLIMQQLQNSDITDPTVALQNLAKMNERVKRKLATKNSNAKRTKKAD